MFMILSASALLEFLSYTKIGWKINKTIVFFTLAGTLAGSILALRNLEVPISALFALIVFYRLFNIYKAAFGLVTPERRRRNSLTTSTRLFFISALLLATSILNTGASTEVVNVYLTVSLLLLLFALMALGALKKSENRMDLPELSQNHASRDLPTITVAIPARNETEDLEECLRTLIASTYPKLEIITLDDCSQNRRTPEIIRGFAHSGVRFIHGEIPPAPWLAKNFAYEQLIQQANGEYIMFCGVDARFEPHSLTRLVEGIVQSEKDMISLMPVNHVSQGHIFPYLIQPIRYAWEIALPRRWRNRPPVISTCWIARKSFLKGQGGFAGIQQAILPERYLARHAVEAGTYGFYRSCYDVGVSSVKSGPEQLDTAVRTRYPIVRRAPELVMLLSLSELCLATLPALFIIFGVLQDNVALIAVNAATIFVLSVVYGVMDKITYENWKFASFIAMPFALIFDAIVLHISMFKYEFSEVLWKGRNICLPLLETIPQFPRLTTKR